MSQNEPAHTHHVTQVLQAVARGEPGAAEELLPLVYDELRKLARSRMRRLKPGQTLEATALVHDAWVRLGGREGGDWDNRGHFFSAAARAMRNILVEQARRRGRLKRGGDREREQDLERIATPASQPLEDLLALDEALTRLEKAFPRQARTVMLRHFAGLTIPEIAEVLQVTPRTVDRDWSFARTWLRREVEGE